MCPSSDIPVRLQLQDSWSGLYQLTGQLEHRCRDQLMSSSWAAVVHVCGPGCSAAANQNAVTILSGRQDSWLQVIFPLNLEQAVFRANK